MVLNVEPGSITSLMTRLRSASGGAAPGLFGSKSGSDAIARISPVRGRVTMPVMLTGSCSFIASASDGFDNVLDRRVNRQHGVQAVARPHVLVAQRHKFLLMLSVAVTRQPATPLKSEFNDSSMPSRPEICETGRPSSLYSSTPENPSTCAASEPFGYTRIWSGLGINGVLPQIAEQHAVIPRQFFFIHAEGKLVHRQLNFPPGFLR